MKKIYIVGSLRNPKIPLIGNQIRELGFDAFDEWFGAGEIADDSWRDYEKTRGRPYSEALYSFEAQNIYQFDLKHLNESDMGVMVLPAGRSGHLELGYLLGQGKPGYILFDGEPARWDVMYQFATKVFFNVEDLLKELAKWSL